ncbi:hypothetical protein [Halomonas denitrificans]|nr:hypothetical protein [Halomonas denitrificans]
MNLTKHASDLPSIRDQRLRVDRRHFNLIFAAAFPFYLATYGIARVLPKKWRSSVFAVELDDGVVEQARLQARLIASYATMV